MSVRKPIPEPTGEVRRANAKSRRDSATNLAHNRFHRALQPDGGRTQTNGEEALYEDTYCTNFTKGLQHDPIHGVLTNTADYELFVDGINQESDTHGVAPDQSWFEELVPCASAATFTCTINGGSTAEWRGWESPRSGHAYDLEGPDAESLCMPPAPALASPELHVEVAEVYALALLRDVPFSEFSVGTASASDTDVKRLGRAIESMPWFDATHIPANPREAARRSARGINPASHQTVFRGSAPGAKDGPYISQFLLTGATGRGGAGAGAGAGTTNPQDDASFESNDGYIVYGTQIIDQRNFVHQPDIDFMTEWGAWLDVQNGANFKGTDQFLSRRRFITTPRDLATFVHFDELYQSYFNAALLLNGHLQVPFEPGFPSGKRFGYAGGQDDPIIKRDSFATFGGPHLLGLLTEVSTRALRAVRRQKFNYHRRARPEVMGWIASLAASTDSAELGNAATDAAALLAALPDDLVTDIQARNSVLNDDAHKDAREVKCAMDAPTWLAKNNLLLPMAFPEGSPMHPAYGAGHATVAGACVTILKAFFQLRVNGVPIAYEVPGSVTTEIYDADASAGATLTDNENSWGSTLRVLAANEIVDETGSPTQLTIEGELNKLAANIAIGRNMAGVHFYTDYYDSLRLGERIAIGIVQEQMSNYPDSVSVSLGDFDDREITIVGSGDANTIVMVDGQPATDSWWACELSATNETAGQVPA